MFSLFTLISKYTVLFLSHYFVFMDTFMYICIVYISFLMRPCLFFIFYKLFSLSDCLFKSIRTAVNVILASISVFGLIFTFICVMLSCYSFCYRSGPSCSKLTTSLVNVSLKFQMLIS